MIMKIAASGVALALICAAPVATAESQETTTTDATAPQSDQAFIKKAIEGNLAEVQMGKLAQEKGEDDDVRELGETLVKDHGAANEKAMELAKSAGMTPPSSPSAEHKATHDELATLSGAAFDRQYIQVMIKEHKQDIEAYTQAAKGSGPVAEYAEEMLPKLREHLEEAEEIAKDMGSEKRSEK